MADKPHIVILGAGVMGMAVAYRLLQTGAYKVSVVSEFFSPGTLSDRSVGIWGPYLPGVDKTGSEFQRVLQWGAETKTEMIRLMQKSPQNDWGIYISQVWMLSANKDYAVEDCPYHSICDNLFVVNNDPTSLPPGFNSGLSYAAPQVIPVRYLKHLTQKVLELGCKFVRKHVETVNSLLAELEKEGTKTDLVVNCLGLGSRSVAGDTTLEPVRGVLVKYPPVPHLLFRAFECLVEGEETYAVFRPDCTLLGGTAIKGDWTKQNKPEEVESVIKRNIKMIPDLAKYEHISDWSGLRPGRPNVRLEVDMSLAKVPVIHNYGHGGAGWSLHWGCASNVQELLVQCLSQAKL